MSYPARAEGLINSIKVKWTRHAGHCWRSKDKLILECSSSEYSLEHQEGKIICASVVSFIPSVVIGCEPRSGYASMHICWPAYWHFCLFANATQTAEPASIVYYFLLCVRAVASSVMYSCGPLHMDEQRQDDQLEPTYSISVPIKDVALKTCREQWTIEKGGEKGSGISVLMVRQWKWTFWYKGIW